MVAGQPAIQLGLFLLVAVNAELHLKNLSLQTIHSGYLAVTLAAVQLPPAQVRLMSKFDEVGHIINPHPGDRSMIIEIVFFFEYLRVAGDDIFVTVKTLFHLRQTGVFRSFHIGVTKPAVDGLDPDMDPVTERNGLNRTGALAGIGIIKIDHKTC
jgi:hypothetical protein